MGYATPEQRCFPPIAGSTVRADFDGGALPSDFGALLLRGIDRQIGLTVRLAAAVRDTRHPSSIDHAFRDLFAQRLSHIASGYADGNDTKSLRHDPLFQLSVERLPLAPDQDLANGAVASVHVASIPWAGSGYRMEIYGREGTLIATSDESPQLGNVHVQGAKAKGSLETLNIPPHYRYVPEAMPQGAPYNVGQLYTLFARAIRSGDCSPSYATFDTAVDLHRLIDAIGESSTHGRQIDVSAASSHRS